MKPIYQVRVQEEVGEPYTIFAWDRDNAIEIYDAHSIKLRTRKISLIKIDYVPMETVICNLGGEI